MELEDFGFETLFLYLNHGLLKIIISQLPGGFVSERAKNSGKFYSGSSALYPQGIPNFSKCVVSCRKQD